MSRSAIATSLVASWGEGASEPKTVIGDTATIRSHTVTYANNTIASNFVTGHAVTICEGNEIGDNVSIGTHSVVEHHMRIGNGVRIHSHAFIPEYSVLEDGCWVAPNVVFANALYPLSPRAKEPLQGLIIRSNAKIGANATLLPGIVVGRNALVGAGAVVVRDLPDSKVVVGNPARVIEDIAELEAYETVPIVHGSSPRSG